MEEIPTRFRGTFGRSNIRLARKGPEGERAAERKTQAMKKAASQPPFRFRDGETLLAEMPAAVFALEPGAGLADEAVTRGVAVIVARSIVAWSIVVIGIGVAA